MAYVRRTPQAKSKRGRSLLFLSPSQCIKLLVVGVLIIALARHYRRDAHGLTGAAELQQCNDRAAANTGEYTNRNQKRYVNIGE